MASSAGSTGWLKGRVKAVTSGDCLVIIGSTKAEIPPEKTVTLSSLVAPRLARRGGVDEPFAWDSREYLRKLCIGKEVTFKIDYSVPSIGREFGSVFLGDKNVASLVVSEGWVKVREQGQQKGEVSPFLSELLKLEEQAKEQGLGRWSKVPGASEAAIRNLPPSSMGDSSNLDAMRLLAENKGKPMEGIVEQVRDGSTIRVYLVPSFKFVQVFVAGVQAPSMGRRAPLETLPEPEPTDDADGETSVQMRPLTSAQKLAATVSTEVAPDPFGREAKHFTEFRVLGRDVRIVLEGVDKFSNLIGSVYYPDGDTAKDLALELVENGLAKFVEWSANMMEEDAKRKLKTAELQAKKDHLRIWENFVPPTTNSKAIHDQNFTGKNVSENSTRRWGKKKVSESAVQQKCKYYLSPDDCPSGSSCKFRHQVEGYGSETVQLNFMGLPIRRGVEKCSYYMRTGSCKFSINCRYHHPEPTEVGGSDSFPDALQTYVSQVPTTQNLQLHLQGNDYEGRSISEQYSKFGRTCIYDHSDLNFLD